MGRYGGAGQSRRRTMGIGPTKPLHIASRRWDHDGSEKGALWTGNAPPIGRVAPRG